MGRARRILSTTDRIFYKLDRETQWLRQKKKCFYCSELILRREITFDHIVPISQTGNCHSVKNCVVACWECNQLKGDSLITEPEVTLVIEQPEWSHMIDAWSIKMTDRIRRFEYTFEETTRGGYHKWVRYWNKRNRWT